MPVVVSRHHVQLAGHLGLEIEHTWNQARRSRGGEPKCVLGLGITMVCNNCCLSDPIGMDESYEGDQLAAADDIGDVQGLPFVDGCQSPPSRAGWAPS
jgi:hypothetical protein